MKILHVKQHTVRSLTSAISSPFAFIFTMYRLHLSLPYIAFIKAAYNGSNERCNALQVYPRPLYPVQPQTSVLSRFFLIFFLNFHVLQCCHIPYLRHDLLCRTILFVIISIFMFCVDAFLCGLLLFPFVCLNSQRE